MAEGAQEATTSGARATPASGGVDSGAEVVRAEAKDLPGPPPRHSQEMRIKAGESAPVLSFSFLFIFFLIK